jgi:putative DeoR family transcriptional regulator (stage III sporulation protein D)
MPDKTHIGLPAAAASHHARARARRIAEYIIEHECTVRRAAEAFGVSKTTAYLDVTRRVDGELAERVREIFARNKEERAIRGGMATQASWRMRRWTGR